jgi:hypothetical protein
MTRKKESVAAVAVSAIGAAAALGAANEADALYHMFYSPTDVLSNMATKPTSTSAGFSLSAANDYGTTWAYGYRSGGTVYANITNQGGSMYARAYARCYSSLVNVYSAAYSDYTTDSGYRAVSCASLPAGAGPWSLQGWGVSVLSSAARQSSYRSLCDGQGCGSFDTRLVSNKFLAYYPALAVGKTGIGGTPSVSVPGPEQVFVGDCW